MDAFTSCMKKFRKNPVLPAEIEPKTGIELQPKDDGVSYSKFTKFWPQELAGVFNCRSEFQQIDHSTISAKDKEKYYSATEYSDSLSVSANLLDNQSKWNNMKDVLSSSNKRPFWGKGIYRSGFLPNFKFQIQNDCGEIGHTYIYEITSTLQNNFTGKHFTINYMDEF